MIGVEQLHKSWPGFRLEIERLEIRDGEYFVALGPSGAGKTVLLSCIGGIMQPDRGRIRFGKRDVTAVAPERRGVGWVSQFNTLFPHLTVEQNIAFGRRYCGAEGKEFDRRAARLVELLDLKKLIARLPAELSGGEVQRAMLARALVLEPRVLLLDEPLRGLDPTTQEFLRDELAQIHRALGTTTFHITHDHIEARALADRIAVIHSGRIEQLGDADEVFEHPASCFVARFTGVENLFALGDPRAGDKDDEIPALSRSLLPPDLADAEGTHVAVRPEHVELWTEDPPSPEIPSGSLHLKGVVASVAKHGGWVRMGIRCETTFWIAFVHPRDAARRVIVEETAVCLTVAPEHICILKEGIVQ